MAKTSDIMIGKLAKAILRAANTQQTKKPKPCTADAEVLRVENGIAYVHITGGAPETPVRMGMACKAGDIVQVRLENGKASLAGNPSAPPTDDTKAEEAAQLAEAAGEAADEAQETADNIKQYFWFKDGNGSEAGAHVTEVPRAEFQKNPQGGNTLLRSVGMYIRKGLSVYASYLVDGVRLFKNGTVGDNVTSLFASFLTSGTRIYDGAGTLIAHLGFGEGKNEQGGTSNTPYYTLGVRANNSTVGNYSTVEGYNNTASHYCAHAEGQDTYALGPFSHSEGEGTQAKYDWSHAEGQQTTADGVAAHSEGKNTAATGAFSHAEGDETKAQSEAAHAEGDLTTASGFAAHAEGKNAKATTYQSHAEGFATTASGNSSHAEGVNATASGDYSHAQNYYTVADQSCQTAIGKYNTTGNTNNLFVVGNGTADNARSDAFTVDRDGEVEAAGSIVGKVDYMEATITANQTISTANSMVTINLNSSTGNGSKLTFNSTKHAIIIGAGVKYVEVSGQGYIPTHGSNGAKNIYIHKGSTAQTRGMLYMANDYSIVSVAPRIIPVTQGDEITLKAYCNGTTTVIGNGYEQTRLTVKVLG